MAMQPNGPAGRPAGDAVDRSDDGAFAGAQVKRRHRVGRAWLAAFQAATVVAIIALSALLYNILNDSMGLIAYEVAVDPASLTPGGRPLADLGRDELTSVLTENLSEQRQRVLESQGPLADRSVAELAAIVEQEIVKPEVVRSYNAVESLLRRSEIEAEVASEFPEALLTWRRWWTWEFVTSPQSSYPEYAGVRTAILGSLWLIAITIVVAMPVGVAAGIYLEEYADKTRRLNGIIQTNINNLAGVPSIIYGILGLTVFVRVLEPITSGSAFGLTDPTTANGRTILSGGLTLALLILPVVIIATQESIRTVPSSLREASFGLGATKWQTVWHNVLPNAIPGILTGAILSISRAIGETAPIVVVGASTYITTDPSGPFSKFTALPMQIYQWTSRPQDTFRDIAAAAIVVLLVLLLLLNATAVFLRNRYTVRY